jgi:hypothetical protein
MALRAATSAVGLSGSASSDALLGSTRTNGANQSALLPRSLSAGEHFVQIEGLAHDWTLPRVKQGRKLWGAVW